MPHTQDRLVMKWIIAFGSLAVVLVVYGGYVRLARAGLSIVEWNPVSGTIPPTSDLAWQAQFEKYQASPEYQQINKGMTPDQYRGIFLIEWLHRLLARLAGLVFALPFFALLLARRIPIRESGIYVVMGLLFLAQAALGWIMVSSGLIERPSVSHYLLAGHLFLALTLIGLSAWTALGHRFGFAEARVANWSVTSRAALAGLLVLLLQMAYGAFTAGLKAGHVSNTWPFMLGRLIPDGLMEGVRPSLLNLIEAPVTVMFIHRWFAFGGFVVGALAASAAIRMRRESLVLRLVWAILALAVLQIVLGIAVVLTGVNPVLASAHQFNGLLLFIFTIAVLHRLRAADDRLRQRAGI